MLYPRLESRSWDEVLELNRPALPRPAYSVHFPLNFPRVKDMVILDGALNAVVLPIPPALDNAKAEDRELSGNLHCRSLSFALEDAPFVMDFHHAKIERIGGSLPQVKASYYAYYVQYTFRYAMGENGRLRVRVSVRNEHPDKAGRKHVWIKMAHPKECGFHDYHYIPFHFNADNFPKFDTTCDFHDNAFWKDGQPIGRLDADGFQVDWKESVFFKDSDFTYYKFYWDSPYYAHPEYRIHSAKNMLDLSVELQPGEEKSFELTMATTLADALPDQLPDFAETSRWNAERWSELEKGLATVEFGDERLDNLFRAVQRCSRQLLFEMDWPGRGKTLFPCQGGTSERFFMWVWEALCEFQPLMRLGYFTEAKELLEFIYSLQDGGYPPVGDFVPAKGAIGTTGPKWACVTGAALCWTHLYLECSRDEEFVRRHLDQIALACNWITAQIRAPHDPGYPYPGLMPNCCATDADVGRLVIFTDNWSCRGMELAAEILTKFHHPDAAKYTAEAARYREDLLACVKDLTTPDGYVKRQIDAGGTYCAGFVNCDPFTYMAYSGIYSLHDPVVRNFIRWCEENSCQDFFFGPMTPHLIYIGNGEEIAALIYLANGETKKAWSAIQAFERYGCTPDGFLTQERFDIDDPEHASWQPNGSNNGRLLDMELARLYLETDRKIVLLGGFAPFELEKPGRQFAIHGLHTRYGRLDLVAKDHTVSIHWEDGAPALPIELPEGWHLA